MEYPTVTPGCLSYISFQNGIIMNTKKVRYFNSREFTFVDGKVKIHGDGISFRCDDAVEYIQENGKNFKRVTGRCVYLSRDNWDALTEQELDKILQCVGLIKNAGKPKAIEPDAFYSPSHAARERGEFRDDIGKVKTSEGWMHKIQPPTWNPSPLMRALGYTRNPAICPHNRKRFIRVWTCSDCGIGLAEDAGSPKRYQPAYPRHDSHDDAAADLDSLRARAGQPEDFASFHAIPQHEEIQTPVSEALDD